MRSILKSTTLESKFPIFAVEHDLIINKEASVTAAFKVQLPELFTLNSAEYEAMHLTWEKALKVLPNYTIVHRQDWFLEENYTPDFENKEFSFLSRNFELHFNERPYLNHNSYLFISQTTPELNKRQSNFTTLCQGRLVPKEINPESVSRFIEAVEQFARIVNDSGLIQLTRINTNEIIGNDKRAGIIEKYLSLSQTTLEDISIFDGQMKIGDKFLCTYTISDAEYLPAKVKTDLKYENLSTDRSDCILSFASPVGLLLPCTHIYNAYIFITNHTENLKQFERQARNMLSLSRYSRANQINREWIEQYLNEAISQGQTSIKFHANIIAWTDNIDKFNNIKNLVGAGIAKMGCKPRYVTIDTPILFWAGIPGSESDFPAEESFYTFPRNALCFFIGETNYKSSLSPFGIKMVDRICGKPLHIDISDLPMRKGIISNRNKFILGPSGSGKSFFTNHMIRQYHEQGAHVLLVDVGNSYQGLCQLINNRTHGEDGIYITYKESDPICFNPFYNDARTFDVEKRESIKTLILTLWKREDEAPSRSEEVALSGAVNAYLTKIIKDTSVEPSFNTFYEFVRDTYREELVKKKVREKDFDIDGFLNVLEPYYRGGEYDFLLNSEKELDLLHKRFIVFELDNIKDNKVLFPIVTLVIMETFLNKMRKLKGIRKVILIEEAWKAIANANMADYIKYLYKTVRKHFGEAIIVSQEIQDVVSSEIVKETIINNSDCKILLDQRKHINKFSEIQNLLGLTDKERDQIFSINMANDPQRLYKEVWIGLGGTQSAVYATEVSLEEYLCYTTEETEKIELLALAEKLNGNFELAIKQLAAQKREKQNLNQ